MPNRYANLVGSNKIKDEWQKINTGFDKVQQEVDQLQDDLDQEIVDREAAVQAVDERVDEIIQGGGPDKDPELVDIRTPDPSYTPEGPISTAGGMTRDMQRQFENIRKKINVVGIPMPPKTGVTKNSPKILRKVNNNRIQVFQALEHGGYIRYTFESGVGGSGSNDAGPPHDLLRIIQARAFVDGYVWYYDDPEEGQLSTVTSPSRSPNSIERRFLTLPSTSINNSRTNSSLPSDYGVSGNIIPSNSTRTWVIPRTLSRSLKLSFSTSSTSSEDVEILIDDVVKKKIDLRTSETGLLSIEIDSPSSLDDISNKVQIRNNTSGNCYFVAFNVVKLKDWKGEHINNYKFIGSTKDFIDTSGASDYAIRFSDVEKWHGSYHGGETSLLCDIVSSLNSDRNYELTEGDIKRQKISDMPDTWGVTSSIKIIQNTNIGDHAKTVSIFNFDKDGTLEMDVSMYDIVPKINTLYTALTSTHKDFLSVIYPVQRNIPTNEDIYFEVNEGNFVQYNDVEKMGLRIRFSKFTDLYNDVGARIKQNESYSKFYYGIVNFWEPGAVVPSVNFSKGLDFFVDSW